MYNARRKNDDYEIPDTNRAHQCRSLDQFMNPPPPTNPNDYFEIRISIPRLRAALGLPDYNFLQQGIYNGFRFREPEQDLSDDDHK